MGHQDEKKENMLFVRFIVLFVMSSVAFVQNSCTRLQNLSFRDRD